MIKNKNGITLIALTIIVTVLSIIASVTIAISVNTGLIDISEKTKQDYEVSNIKQILDSIYLSEKNKYTSGLISEEQMWSNVKSGIDNNERLAEKTIEYINISSGLNVKIDGYEYELQLFGKWKQEGLTCSAGTLTVQVGDYVAYEPQTEVTSYEISNVYSGYDTTSKTYEKYNSLNWRVLGVNKEGKLELISDATTDKSVYLQGYQGYNNGVYLLNDMCNSLYGNKANGSTAREVNIEDIQNVMNLSVWDYKDYATYGDLKEYTNVKYPTILELEKKQEVNEREGTKYEPSEQKELILQTEEKTASSIKLIENYWTTQMTSENFVNDIYYKLFINNGDAEYAYWLSTRTLGAYTDCYYGLCSVITSSIGNASMYSTASASTAKASYLRPIVTLGNSVGIKNNSANSETHTTTQTAWDLDSQTVEEQKSNLIYFGIKASNFADEISYSGVAVEGMTWADWLENPDYHTYNLTIVDCASGIQHLNRRQWVGAL